MKGPLLTLLAAGAAGTFAVCDLCGTPSSARAAGVPVAQHAVTPARAPAAELQTVTLRIEGMTCGGCAIAARKVLQRLDGVEKAEASYEKQRAVVTYDPKKVTVDQMIAAVKTLGYAATVVQG